ncbi:MAG TPA: BamA/TamA family outer membrane protein [Polyangiaceae bacterium]|jgi:hypothetical protein|nr:BamA/TamA family outer membrane protein [Polyangiaceae bacterium]
MNGARALVTRVTLRIGLLLAVHAACAAADARAADGEETPSDTPVPVPEQAEAYKGEGLVVVPLAMYSPETHVGLGGLLVRFFRVGDSPVESRVSSISVIALVTTRHQAIIECLPELYWDNENNYLAARLEYQRYPDSFWGVGDDTPEDAEERYLRERLRLRITPRRRITGPFYAGLNSDFMLQKGTYSDTGIFATEDVPGENGGFTSGIGPAASYDTRDNTVSSRAGTLLQAAWVGFSEIIGSRYDFWKLQTEARQFIPVGRESALGFRYYGEFQNGDVPFYHMAMLGGDELLRGYFLGRYRDHQMIALDAEYRFPLFWRFGAVAFAGVAEVAAAPKDFDFDPLRWAVGGGLRYALSKEERLNLRLDAGVGPDTFGVYFTAREAF